VSEWVVTGRDSSRVLMCQHTPKYHVADKHDIQPSHIKLTLGQPTMF